MIEQAATAARVDIGAFELLRPVDIRKVGNVLEIDDRATNVDFVTVETAIINQVTRILVNGVALNATTYPAASITGIKILGGNGNDVIDLSRIVPSHLPSVTGTSVIAEGEAGNDLLIGSALNDSLRGGDGDDLLEGRSGGDTMTGGAGSDTYRFAGTVTLGIDTLVESSVPDSGVDTLDFSELNFGKGINVDLRSLSRTVILQNGKKLTLNLSSAAAFENVIGTSFDDIIYGNGVDNWLVGGNGADAIYANDGDDHIEGGDGDDSALDGGGGDDWIFGGSGSDNLIGGEGQDVIDGGVGSDSVIATTGDDVAADQVSDPDQMRSIEDENEQVNHFPQMPSPSNLRVRAETEIEFQLQATDPDAGQTLEFSTLNPLPSGATLTPSGLFSWTPSEAQAGISYEFHFVVTDSGDLPLHDEKSFTIFVDSTSTPIVFRPSLSPYGWGFQIHWPSVPNATAYKVERKTADAEWEVIETTANANIADGPNTRTNFAHRGVPHEYRITALNGTTELMVSSTVRGFSPAPEPYVDGVRQSNGSIQVTLWNPDASSAWPQLQYAIERYSTFAEGWVPITTVDLSTSSYLDTTSLPNVEYIYRARAIPTSSEFSTLFEQHVLTPDGWMADTSQFFVPIYSHAAPSNTSAFYVEVDKQPDAAYSANGILIPLRDSAVAPLQHELTKMVVSLGWWNEGVTLEWTSPNIRLFDGDMNEIVSGALLQIDEDRIIYIRGVVESTDSGDVELTLTSGSAVATVKATVVAANLTVDSNNDGNLDETDDLIEDNVGVSGKWLMRNVRDYDGDGIPGFADGRTTEAGGQSKVDSGPAGESPYGIVELSLPKYLDPAKALIKFEGFNPLPDAPLTIPNQDGVYQSPSTSIGLWHDLGGDQFHLGNDRFRVNRKSGRVNETDPNDAGGWVPGYTWIPVSDFASGPTLRFYVEGLSNSGSMGDIQLKVTIAPLGHTDFGQSLYLQDTVKLTVIEVNLPSGSPLEEQREEVAAEAKLIPINDGNRDATPYVVGGTPAQNADYFLNDPAKPILDMFDGYTHSSISPSQGGSNKSAGFLGELITISKAIDFANARIRFNYDMSIPGTASSSELTPHDGAMRVWKRNGTSSRNPSFVPSGDLIKANEWYSLSELGFTLSGGNYVLPVYIEGVNPSDAGNALQVELKPGTASSVEQVFIASDVAKLNVGDYLVSGRVNYAPGNEEVAGRDEAPARHIKLNLSTYNFQSDKLEVVATTFTNEIGEFVFHSSQPFPPSVQLWLTAIATTDPNANPDTAIQRSVSVEVEEGQPYSYVISTFYPEASQATVRIDAVGSKAIGSGSKVKWVEAKAFATLDAFLTGALLHEELPGSTNGHASVRYVTSQAVFTTQSVTTLAIDTAFQWDVILHEYGHIVAEDLGFDRTDPFWSTAPIIGHAASAIGAKSSVHDLFINGRVHYFNHIHAKTLAFNEGWANFFSLLAQAEIYEPPLSNTTMTQVNGAEYFGADGNSGNLEVWSNSDKASGEDEEMTVSRILWDLYDGNNDEFIQVPRNSIVASLRDIGTNPQLHILWQYMQAQPGINTGWLTSIFVKNGAAPNAVEMVTNGQVGAAFEEGQAVLDVKLRWNMPQAMISLGVEGTPSIPPQYSNAFERVAVEIIDSMGTVVTVPLAWQDLDGEGFVESLSNGDLNFALQGLATGTYLWGLRASWTETSGVFESQKLAFTINPAN